MSCVYKRLVLFEELYMFQEISYEKNMETKKVRNSSKERLNNSGMIEG